MKKLFTFLIGIAISATSFAQAVPNGGFETVSGTTATGWLGLGGVVQAREELELTVNGEPKLVKAHSGTYGLEVSTSQTVVGRASTERFAISSRPVSLRMNAIFIPRANGEAFAAICVFTKWNADSMRRDTLYNQGSAVGQSLFPWVNATFNMIDTAWKSSETPDSAVIILSSGVSTVRSPGTLLWVDNVVFSEFAASTKDVELQTLTKTSVYPSPAAANSTSTIKYTLHTNTNVKVDLYDINGKLIQNVINEEQTYGEKELQVGLGDLAPGVYFYNIKTEQSTKSVKFVVQ